MALTGQTPNSSNCGGQKNFKRVVGNGREERGLTGKGKGRRGKGGTLRPCDRTRSTRIEIEKRVFSGEERKEGGSPGEYRWNCEE